MFKTSGADIRTKIAVILSNTGRYPVSAQCRILNVPRATYYWTIKYPREGKSDPLTEPVAAVWRDGRERYGARKVKAVLARQGIIASRRRICRIVSLNNMVSAYAKPAYKPHVSKVNEAALPNILNREFNGYQPHTHIVSDLTYVRVVGQWHYVCLLIDLHNREIAGYAVGASRDADLVKAAFATLRFPLSDIEVFHTDRGSEFDNLKIDMLLDVFAIQRSLSRKGNPYDNAVVESTNRLLKKELIYQQHYTTLNQLRAELNAYVWWYNHQHIHSTLEYKSPIEYAQQHVLNK